MLSEQGDLFPARLDRAESERRKEAGMNLAADAKDGWLERLRGVAVSIAMSRASRECSTDDIQQFLVECEIAIPKGPFWGSIFRGSDWEFTGRRIRSALPSNHAREIKIWKLRGTL